ncbi:hypothetical protein D6T65_05285 [Arthrobacter frigidicola]|nr:hypothetical protein D6T65_05285 [Arthrobacter frigidicola]
MDDLAAFTDAAPELILRQRRALRRRRLRRWVRKVDPADLPQAPKWLLKRFQWYRIAVLMGFVFSGQVHPVQSAEEPTASAD